MTKSTEELLEMMKNNPDYASYLEAVRDNVIVTPAKIDEVLNRTLEETGMKKADVIARSGIEQHYAYQIFSGKRIPTRDKAIMMCFGFGMDIAGTQKFLKITGYAELYGKELRDNAILFGLTNRMSVIDVNGMLYDLGLPLLV